MEPKIKIEWKNGRHTHIPDPSIDGEVVEYDLCYDDISEGLYLEMRRHEPLADDGDDVGAGMASFGDEYDNAGTDRPGAKFCLAAVGYVQLVEPGDMQNVLAVWEDGQEVMATVEGELVVLAKANALARVYLDDDAASTLLMLGELADIVGKTIEAGSGQEADALLAYELGISVHILQTARAYKVMQDETPTEGDDGSGNDAHDAEQSQDPPASGGQAGGAEYGDQDNDTHDYSN